MKKAKVLLILGTLVLIGVCVMGGIFAHQAHILEMEAQIAQLGYYKEDLVMLIDNHYKEVWLVIGAIVSGGLACIGICTTIDLAISKK